MTTADSAAPPSTAAPWQFSLRQLFVLVTALSLLFGLLYWVGIEVGKARQAAHIANERNDFKQAQIGLQNFNDTYKHLPYAMERAISGVPSGYTRRRQSPDDPILYSWRYTCLNYHEATPYFKHDIAWDDPRQLQVRAIPFRIYCGEHAIGPNRCNTRILAITGPGTAWGDGDELPLSLKDISADTILIVESRNSGLHWMQPGDFDIRTMPRTINAPDGSGICGEYPTGFFVGLADASVHYVRSDVPFELLERFFTVAGAEEHDFATELAPYQNEL